MTLPRPIRSPYEAHVRRKQLGLWALGGALCLLFLLSLRIGAIPLSWTEVLRALLEEDAPRQMKLVVWNIRLPQALCALAVGSGLAMAGACLQTLLQNPLASPFTLGISHAAAFGAALSVMFLGGGGMGSTLADAVAVTHLSLTVTCAFLGSLFCTGILLLLSGRRGSTSESIILSGVALGTLFTAGTLVLQFFADDSQLAAMVFWTFGDLSRVRWPSLVLMGLVVSATGGFFLLHRWHYNALAAGEETAASLGVPVRRVRLGGMLASALVTSAVVAFVGVIGFVGLLGPHLLRGLLGDDHRYLLPGSALLGSLILLLADLGARTFLAPRILPVSVVTSFLGVPLFLFLVLRKNAL
ncbi:transport system permease protein [Aminomonas paucivorans DSM 12260]|uniref:Transport system permease protein n=1 Tax=Aminomonas paucivorans DSM 12260 TaxID=584708 RepID=E3CWP9_9BACT|nr:iron ABC transporter permease [Aminomonas paucivorans]EFQ22554.1 transport system permease protein [Aminomonas paucivorans DSM 12260]